MPDQESTTSFTADERSRVRVFLVHGLYMNRLWLRPLATRLRVLGWPVSLFAYPSMFESPASAGERLMARVFATGAGRVHLVGHSLGGLVIRHALQRAPYLPSGRVVTLGTPHHGSRIAALLRRRHLGWMLGASRRRALYGDVPQWPSGRELGTIAGDRPFGLAQLIARLPAPNDGVVGVAEASCSEASDACVLPVSHSGMLFSAQVVRQIDRFLLSGHFAVATDERADSGA